MTSPIRVLIGTPAYNGLVHTSYVHTLLELASLNVSYSLYTISNESLITRARNTILAHFHHLPDLTHLLFLDADIGIRGTDLQRLLSHGKDVIGAPVQLKVDDGGKPPYNVGQVYSRERALAKVSHLGSAVLILSRAAVDALIGKAEDEGRTYLPLANTRGDVAPGKHHDVFRVGSIDGVYYSEDYWVCRELRELGFDVHADLAIRVRHFGMHGFGG
jgi:hypothetical protein